METGGQVVVSFVKEEPDSSYDSSSSVEAEKEGGCRKRGKRIGSARKDVERSSRYITN